RSHWSSGEPSLFQVVATSSSSARSGSCSATALEARTLAVRRYWLVGSRSSNARSSIHTVPLPPLPLAIANSIAATRLGVGGAPQASLILGLRIVTGCTSGGNA